MGDSGFGELIRRPQPDPPKRKIVIPPSKPPQRTPLKITVHKPTRLPTPSQDFRKRADELRRRVIQRDPSLARPPEGPPKRTPLKITARQKPPEPPERTPLRVDVKPKSQFEWVRAA